MNIQSPAILLALLIASCGLVACNNDQQHTVPISHAAKKYSQATTLEGVVSDSKGRVKAGQIKVIDSKQQSIASTEIQNNGQYRVEIPAETELPIVLSVHHEASLANAEQLLVAVIDPMISKYDISPLTTAIANKAKAMGGYTRSNLVLATEGMVHVPDANKTSTGFRGDPTTQYGGWH
jgi:hypothetical protein